MRLTSDDEMTRAAFDVVAADYARLLPDLTHEAPFDRAVLTAFVELVRSSGSGTVVDVGCGSGRITAHLADADLNVLGLDLSPGMVGCAKAARPDLRFAVAHAAHLPLRSATMGAVLAWYSLINVRPELIPAVLKEFARVTAAGAPLVVAFQSGEGQRVDREIAYGHPVPITYFRHSVDDMVHAVTEAGFDLYATVRRHAMRPLETTPQAFVLATRAESDTSC